MKRFRTTSLLLLLAAFGCDGERSVEQQFITAPAAGPEASFTNGSAAEMSKLEHVTICHKPGSRAEQVLTVPQPGVAPHLQHGDSIGACGQAGGVFIVPETVSGGWAHTCGLATSGISYCWGLNTGGQLGNGYPFDRSTPTSVAGPAFVQITVGNYHGCGLTSAGRAYCWGKNNYGQLGDGTTSDRFTPVGVSGALVFTRVSAGGSHTCGVTSSGVAYCWGQNVRGQLGDGTTTQRLTPTATAGGVGFQQVSAGSLHSCGLTLSGGALCWGYNYYGQLGNGTTVDIYTPTVVTGGLAFVDVSVGGSHTCGLTASRAAYCWGGNYYGQLGNGTQTNRASPTAVSGGGTFDRISAGGSYTCATNTILGSAWCWGSNAYGQLGDGSTTNRTTPTAVAGGLAFSQVNAGDGSHSCGLTTTGAAYCWGNNASFELGDGTAIQRVTPTVVAGGLVFKQ